MVDYYSFWFGVELLKDTTSRAVITRMKSQFARYGVPEEVITDNSPQFRSKDFDAFVRSWSFTHTTSSPYFPQSNGMVERAVQEVKRILGKAKEDGSDPYLTMLNARNTPRDNIVGSPAQRLHSRRLKTVLPISRKLLKPQVVDNTKVQQRLEQYKKQQKFHYDRRARRLSPLKEGETVRTKSNKGFGRKAVVERECN